MCALDVVALLRLAAPRLRRIGLLTAYHLHTTYFSGEIDEGTPAVVALALLLPRGPHVRRHERRAGGGGAGLGARGAADYDYWAGSSGRLRLHGWRAGRAG
jgi:hypothetical protein